MLTKDQEYVLALLRASLASKPIDVTPENENSVSKMIRHHDILLTVYPFMTSSLQEELRMEMLANVQHATQQNYEGGLIQQALTEAGLHCVPLKGLEQRELYPQGTLRQMADIDILVRPYDYKTVSRVMKEQGYQAEGETFWLHDNFLKGNITVEMHKRLTDDSDAIRDWEGRMLARTRKSEDGIFHMTIEDQLIFHIVHMYKDFLNGALGLRRIADTWLLSRQKLDLELVGQEMEKIGLSDFYERMVRLSESCMGERSMDQDVEVMLDHAFKMGIYGTNRSYQAGRIVSMSKGRGLRRGKLRSFAAAIFLPVSRMKVQFPLVEKMPVLLPYFWVKRILLYLHSDVEDYKQKLDYGKVTDEDYAEMKRFFKAGGLKL